MRLQANLHGSLRGHEVTVESSIKSKQAKLNRDTKYVTKILIFTPVDPGSSVGTS